MEKNIHKFITHVVNNLFSLNEYSDAEVKRLMIQFKQEADDLNIEISDKELEAAIKRFDQLKNSPKIVEKDLRQYNLAKLLKITSSSEGADIPEDESGPDVIYSEDGYTIYSGGNEELCQRHRNDVPWCITRSSFGNYRYSADRGFPSFYLIRNVNLPNSNPLSFVAIQVRNDGSYVYTNRNNSPNESPEMGWGKLNSEIPWLQNIPNVKSLLRYVPLSSKEKVTQLYGKNPISIREWENLSFNEKKQYIVVRKGKNTFSDISTDEFIEKYLPNYPQLATFIATNADIIDSALLLKHLDKFSVNDRKSITANLRNPISADKYLSTAVIPFEVKKLLVKLNKWDLEYNERLYVTKNNEAIVKLTFEGNEVKIGVYTGERDYPNIKLNSRTAKFLLDYPDLDKLPLPTILSLVDQEIVNTDFVNQILTKAQEDPESAIIVKDTDTGKIVLDSNSFSSYKVKNGKLTPIPFNDEEVKDVLKGETENSSFQNSAVELVFKETDLPSTIDKNSFLNILNNTPYNERTRTYDGVLNTILVNPQYTEGKPIFAVRNDIFVTISEFSYGERGNWYARNSRFRTTLNLEDYKIYIKYLKATNRTFTDNDIKQYLINIRDSDVAKAITDEGIPMAAGSILRPATVGDTVLLVNTVSPNQSYIVSDRSGKLLNKVVTASQARQILGVTTPTPQAQTPQAQAPQAAGNQVRRGRPAGIAGVPRPAAAPVAGGLPTSELMADRGLETAFNSLPGSVRARLTTAVQENGISRGASRRNNQLGNRGRVTSTYNSGPSSIYFITLANGSRIASINIQPGNGNYILIPGQEYIRLNSPTELLSALQARRLAEVLIAEFMSSNPTMIDETKKILRYYKNQFKKSQTQESMKINKLKQIIKEELRAILAEKSPEVAPAPTKPKTKEEETKKKNPLHPNPNTNPKTKPKAKANEAVSKGITDIIKKYKSLKKLNENTTGEKYSHLQFIDRNFPAMNHLFIYPNPNSQATKEQYLSLEPKSKHGDLFKIHVCKNEKEAEKKRNNLMNQIKSKK
jgi:hypothetical protein